MRTGVAATFLFLVIAQQSSAGTFRGQVFDLDGQPLRNLPNIEVTVTAEDGRLVSGAPTVDLATGTFTVTVNDAVFAAVRPVVSVTIAAAGRETVTLTNMRGNGASTLEVVLPEEKPTVAPPARKKCCLFFFCK
jgi:hypothetical protein